MPQTQIVKPLSTIETAREDVEINALLAKKGVYKVHLDARLSSFKRLPAERPGFISGPVGSGKTYLAVAYLADAIMRARAGGNEQHQADREVGRIEFTRAVDLMMILRNSFRDGERGPGGFINILSRFKFLVIDDLGTERDTPLVAEALYSIFDYRAGQLLPTLITSNFDLTGIASLYGSYGERLASRIAGMGGELLLKGKDRRW